MILEIDRCDMLWLNKDLKRKRDRSKETKRKKERPRKKGLPLRTRLASRWKHKVGEL